MKYKVKTESELHSKFNSLIDRMSACRKEALLLAESLGFDALGGKHNCAAGGISCLQHEGPKPPEGYKRVGKDYQKLCFPKANNKEVLKKISELPIVTNEEYNGLINFEATFVGNVYIRRFGLMERDGVYLIDTGEADYTPVDGMEEILESEYKRLKAEK